MKGYSPISGFLKYFIILFFILFNGIVNGKIVEDSYGPLTQEQENKITEHLAQLQLLVESKSKLENNFLGVMKHEDGIICKSCRFTVDAISEIIQFGFKRLGFFRLLSFFCRFTMTKEACDGYVYHFGPVIVDSLAEHYINGEYICTLMKICSSSHFIELNADDYARELLRDKPAVEPIKIDQNAKTWRALHVTDIHTDLKYTEGTIATCSDTLCCRPSSVQDKKSKQKTLSGRWGHVGKCDLPLPVLLNFAHKMVNDIKPDFVIWTGDNPAHDEWNEDTQEEIYAVSELFTQILNDGFKNTIPIYPSMGNHEKFPADQFFPYDNEKESPILNFFANLWRGWLGEEAYESFKKNGYYTKKHLDTNLRIVSTNCLYCDAMNFFLLQKPNDPNGQIKWLEETLRKAEIDGEVVYLIGHIPAGDTSMLSECALRFKAIIDRFSHIIRFQVSGHTHFDEVKTIKEYFNQNKTSSIVYISPSLTTY
jgi:sphingomyelin phosphodiesterase